MTIERGLRGAAGVVVLVSVALGCVPPSRLAALDGFRRIESTAIGLYELVPDGVDSGPPGIPALRALNRHARQPRTWERAVPSARASL